MRIVSPAWMAPITLPITLEPGGVLRPKVGNVPVAVNDRDVPGEWSLTEDMPLCMHCHPRNKGGGVGGSQQPRGLGGGWDAGRRASSDMALRP
jgi:hypothetical protein